jgi:putative chromate ion transporter
MLGRLDVPLAVLGLLSSVQSFGTSPRRCSSRSLGSLGCAHDRDSVVRARRDPTRSGSLLDEARLHQLRRTGWSDRDHEEIVDRRKWVSNARFLHALNFCKLLPGPEAQQLAIYLGWLMHRVKGGLIAGVMFVLPSVFVMYALSWLAAVHSDVTWVNAIFSGLAPAVIALVAWATIRIGSKSLSNGLMLAVAIIAFVAIFVLHVPFPLIVVAALAVGFVGGAMRPDVFDVGVAQELEEQEQIALRDDAPRPSHTLPTRARATKTLVIGLLVWLVPIALIAAWRGPDDRLTERGWFFSRAALITFGGAYAVLAFVNVAEVQTYGWLLPGQMVVGLVLAESTPGPLIMVLEFVGFVGPMPDREPSGHGRGHRRHVDVAGRVRRDPDDGVERLFGWFFDGDVEVPHHAPNMPPFRTSAASAGVLREALEGIGALIAGRHLFDVANGWEGGQHPVGVPIFVVTHEAPDDWEFPGAPLTFVTDGVASAIDQAQAVAGDRIVSVASPTIAQQALELGCSTRSRSTLSPSCSARASPTSRASLPTSGARS